MYPDGAGDTYKSFCFKVLSLVEQRRGETTFDSFTVSELLQWVPDPNGYLKPLALSQAGKVRKQFGMTVLSLACNACLWGGVSQQMRDVWRQATPLQLLGCLGHLRESMPEEEKCWPVPHTIAKHLVQKNVQ